jgi:outer membrane protein assembly factor BamB
MVAQLDPSTGRVLREIRLTDFTPYGAAIASDGTLWLTEAATGRIQAIDTRTGTVGIRRQARTRDGCSGSYGIAIDSRDRVWLAGFNCSVAFRFDPSTRAWFEVPLPDSGAGRGIAADDRGFVYMGASHEFIRIRGGAFIEVGPEISRVTRFRADDGGDVRIVGTAARPLPGLQTIGVGLDSMRNVWIVNQASGSATRVDFETGAFREFEVGVEPYTYSDFTGYALRTFTAPNGYLRTIVSGCPVGPTEWERVSWNATVTSGARVDVRVRSADTVAGLATAPWVGPFTTTPSELGLPPGPVEPLRYLEVEVNLVADSGMRSPRVRSVSVQLNCPI